MAAGGAGGQLAADGVNGNNPRNTNLGPEVRDTVREPHWGRYQYKFPEIVSY